MAFGGGAKDAAGCVLDDAGTTATWRETASSHGVQLCIGERSRRNAGGAVENIEYVEAEREIYESHQSPVPICREPKICSKQRDHKPAVPECRHERNASGRT